MSDYRLNEELLTEDAFRPKRYHIRLEKGKFRTPYDRVVDPYTPTFTLRLVFDKSPYPAREEWREAQGAPDQMRFWEWDTFCGRQLK